MCRYGKDLDRPIHMLRNYDQIDHEIISLFATDKERAFRRLYDTYYRALCLYAVQITGQVITAEDVVQGVFVDFYDRSQYTQITTSLHAYLFQAVRFAAYTKVQQNHFFPLEQVEEQSYSPIDEYYDEEHLLLRRRRILDELKQLPEQEYKVVVGIVLRGKRYKEVAAELGISVNTVKTHLSRGLKALRQLSIADCLLLCSISADMVFPFG